MAKDFVTIDHGIQTNMYASMLLEYTQYLRKAYDLGTKIKAIMDHNQDGVSFTDIETLFGVETGQGQTVYDLVNGSVGAFTGAFQTSDQKTITEKIG